MLKDRLSSPSPNIALRLFAILFAIYAITSPGDYEVAVDGMIRYETARSWLEGRGGALSTSDWWSHGAVVLAPNGRSYGTYGPLQSLLMLPTVAIATKLAHGSPDNLAKLLFGVLVIPLLSSLSMVLLFHALRGFEYSPRIAFWTTLLVALATPMWHYGRSGQEENIIGFAFSLYLLGLTRLLRRQFDGLIVISLAASIVFATRMAYLPALAILLCKVALQLWAFRADIGAWRKSALCASALGIVAIGAVLSYNRYRFGTPLETGYGLYFRQHHMPLFVFSALPTNAAALLVSPYRGILWFCPSLLILVGLRKVHGQRAVGELWPFVLGAWVSTLLLVGSYYVWWGGFAWGPRFLVALIVLLAPLFAAVFQSGQQWRLVTCLSVVVQFFSILQPSGTEDLVYTKDSGFRASLIAGCSPWQCRCAAMCLRGPSGGRAFLNTIAGRPLSSVDAPGIGEVSRTYNLLESSDYTRVFWWPIRAAYRAHRLAPSLALVLSLTILTAAGYGIYLTYRATRNDEPRADWPEAPGTV
jgi:hypothetical protein